MFYNQYICNDKDLVLSVLSEVSGNLTSEKNHTNTLLYQGSNSYYNKELFKWFNECLLDLTEKEFIKGITLSITECWATKSQKFEKHHRHVHPNSLVSGIFYLDNSSSTTEFYLPNPWAFMNKFIQTASDDNKKVSIKPEAGKLILFPSNIEHETKINLSFETRHTVAFNTFVSGSVGKPTMRLSINSFGVEDSEK